MKYFCLKHPQMTAGEGDEGWGGGVVASALVLRSSPLTCQKCPFIRRIALLFSRIILLFFRNTLLFPEVALLFSKSVLLFHRSAFLFLKNASFFSRIVLENCPELPSFCFLCASFFFFPADLTFSSSPAQGCSERDFPCSWFVST